MKNLYKEVKRAIGWILFLLALGGCSVLAGCSSGGEFHNRERDASVWQSFDSGTPDAIATGGASAQSSQTTTLLNTTGGATGSAESLPGTTALEAQGGQLAALGGAGSGGDSITNTQTSGTGGSGIDATGGAAATGGDPATGGAATGGDAATGGTVATGGAATGGSMATGGMLATGGAAATGGMIATGGATTDPGECPCPQRAQCKPYQTGCNLPGSKASDWPNEVGLQCVTSPLQCPTAARPVFCFTC